MEIILIGAFSEIFELCEACGLTVSGYVDFKEDPRVVKYDYLGDDDSFLSSNDNSRHQKLVIVPDSPIARRKLVDFYHSRDCFEFPLVVSPSASVSYTAGMGCGSVIQWGSHVSSNASIGSFVKLNVSANVMHDCIVGDFTTIAPNAAIMGGVRIGRLCYIGANATVLPGLSICDSVVVGAGAVVTKCIEEPGVYVGVPARKQ